MSTLACIASGAVKGYCCREADRKQTFVPKGFWLPFWIKFLFAVSSREQCWQMLLLSHICLLLAVIFSKWRQCADDPRCVIRSRARRVQSRTDRSRNNVNLEALSSINACWVWGSRVICPLSWVFFCCQAHCCLSVANRLQLGAVPVRGFSQPLSRKHKSRFVRAELVVSVTVSAVLFTIIVFTGLVCMIYLETLEMIKPQFVIWIDSWLYIEDDALRMW